MAYDYEFINVKKEKGMGIMTLNRPPVNALNKQLIDEIGKCADELEADDEVKAVIVTGAGNYAFVAGADIKEVNEIIQSENAEEEGRALVEKGHETFIKFEKMSKPVIAAINSMTLGGGNEMAMAMDIRIASDRAKFGQPECNLGLIPAYGGTQRLSRLVGPAIAKDLIFTGRMISAKEALRIGLVNKVVPDGEELRAAQDIARKIMVKSSPIAVAASKKAINEGLQINDIEDALAHEADCFLDIAESEDLKEGIAAFIEKRRPKFQGK